MAEAETQTAAAEAASAQRLLNFPPVNLMNLFMMTASRQQQ